MYAISLSDPNACPSVRHRILHPYSHAVRPVFVKEKPTSHALRPAMASLSENRDGLQPRPRSLAMQPGSTPGTAYRPCSTLVALCSRAINRVQSLSNELLTVLLGNFFWRL